LKPKKGKMCRYMLSLKADYDLGGITNHISTVSVESQFWTISLPFYNILKLQQSNQN